MKEGDMFASRATTGLLSLGLLTLLSFGLMSVAGDDPPKKDDPAAADKEVIESKPTRKAAAASVKFRKELGVPFASLNTLGSRIDAARRAHDPVALANAASELAIAEKASGKKASVTSTQLAKESAELAKLRHQVTEMRAAIEVNKQIAAEDQNLVALNKIMEDFKSQAAADSESIRMNQEPTWKPRTVIVNNYSTQYADIWVNGYLKGQVQPGMSQSFVIEHRWNPTVLTGYGDDDEQNWGPVTIWGRFNKYTWNLH
jgi:hypothetical protein